MCALLCGIQFGVGAGASIYGDSPSYFKAWEALKLIHPSEWRPPVYPLIIGIPTELLGKPAALGFILVFHWVCFAVALLLLYQINRRVGIGNGVSCLVVLAVLLLPGMWVLNNLAIPESICGSMIVLLVWLSIRYHDSQRCLWLLASGLLLTILIFTKPVFVILIPIMVAFWVIVGRKRRNHLMIAAGILIFIIGCMAFYAWQIARFNDGIYTLTRASDDNLYYCLREDGLIRPEEIPVDSIRQQFTPFYQRNRGEHAPGENLFSEELRTFSWEEKRLMAHIALQNHPKEAFQGTLQRFKDAATFSQTLYPETNELPIFETNTVNPGERISFFFPLNRWLYTPIWLSWLAMLAYLSGMLVRWKRSRKFPAIGLLIVAIPLVGTVASIAGAQDSWGRLITPFNLMLVPIAGYLIQRVCDSVFQKHPNSGSSPKN